MEINEMSWNINEMSMKINELSMESNELSKRELKKKSVISPWFSTEFQWK